MIEQKYSYLCDVAEQLKKMIEPEFLKEVAELEKEVDDINFQLSALDNQSLIEALKIVNTEIVQLLGKAWDAKDLPSFKGTVALLEAWPSEKSEAVVIQKVISISKQAVLLADKARVRRDVQCLLDHCFEPVKAESRRYMKIDDSD